MKSIQGIADAFFCLALVVAPCWVGYSFISEARECARNGEATATFWLPKNAEIITDAEVWKKHLSDKGDYRDYHKIQLGLEEYKRLFSEEKHLIFLASRQATFVAVQGRVVVSSEEGFGPPSFTDVKEYKHVGGGQIAYELSGSVNYVGLIFVGLLCGVVLDGMIALAYFICCIVCTEVKEKIFG